MVRSGPGGIHRGAPISAQEPVGPQWEQVGKSGAPSDTGGGDIRFGTQAESGLDDHLVQASCPPAAPVEACLVISFSHGHSPKRR